MAPGHHHRRQRRRRAGPATALVVRRQRRHSGGVEPGAAVVRCRGALSRLLPVGRRRHVDAHGRAARLRASQSQPVPHQYGQHGLHRLPHLSRRAGGESANRRHLCLDRGPEQPGPGAVAGRVRHQRRRVRQPHHHFCQAMEHGCARNQHPAGSRRPSPTELTT